MEQDTATTGGDGAFAPTPLGDILRDDAPRTDAAPAGRQEATTDTTAPVETGDASVDLTKDTRPRDEHGRFAPKPEQTEETGPPPAEQTAPQHVPIAAVLEERKKRQALEVRLREMEARLAAPPAPAASPQQQAQSQVALGDMIFQDPEGFVEHLRQSSARELAETRLALSEVMAKKEPDYDDAVSAVLQAASANPENDAYARKMMATHPTPALWALEWGRSLVAQQRWGQVVQQYGSPEAYLAAHQQAPQPVAPAPVAQSPAPPTPPGSLASVRSAGPRSGAAPWTGPAPTSAVFGRR